ncbi:MAG: hypothetical protein J6S85_20810 [Methanobrevibacter sp.]|nr:hypothetical protein [Methanobrevibacter sp.]
MRLTKHYYDAYESDKSEYYIWQKLGQLEDIEDELGIDLITLFKALKNGVYVKMCDYISFEKVGIDENTQLRTFSFSQIDGIQLNYFLDFEDYGKIWALTKEELL